MDALTPPKEIDEQNIPEAPLRQGRRISAFYRAAENKDPLKPRHIMTDDKAKFEPQLEALLRGIFGWKEGDPQHEVMEALVHMNITGWSQFIRLRPEDIDGLTKESRGERRVQISIYCRGQLMVLREMIRERIRNYDEGARDISTYKTEDFIEYEFNYSENKKPNVDKPNVSTHQPSSTQRSMKTPEERRLEDWNRLKPDRKDFDVLADDGEYERWKESFTAVIEVQTLSRFIDPKFDPRKITDPHDKELWSKQQAYMWTVLNRVFKNPLGVVCYSDHIDSRDARAAYFEHDKLQMKSPARMFDTGTLITELKSMHVANRQSSRVQFVTDWFSKMREFNSIASKSSQLGYQLARAVLLSSMTGDSDMTAAFTELSETGNDAIDMANMKTHLLTKAALFDGMNATPQTNSASKITAMAHVLGIDDSDLHTLLAYRARRGPPDPSLRLHDSIYSKLTRKDRVHWHGFSDDAKRAIVAGISDATEQSTRKAYVHQQDTLWADQSSHGVTFADQTQDQSIVADLQNFVVEGNALLSAFKTSQQRGDTASTALSSISSKSRPPPSISSKSKTPDSKEDKTKQELPLKSSVPLSNPARIMADNKKPVVDDNGIFKGFIHQYKAMTYHPMHQTDNEIQPQEHEDIVYSVSSHKIRNKPSMALIDRGANGMVAGEDCKWIGGPTLKRYVHITGIDNHQVRNIPIGTVGAVATSNRGPVICVFNEAAYTGRNQSIISSLQLEHYRNNVDDKAMGVGGGQQITTADGYTFGMSIVNGLPYMKMRPFTQSEYEQLPHVIMTSDEEWNPRTYDNDVDPDSTQFQAANPKNLHLLPHDDYNVKGEYIGANKTDISEPKQEDFPFWMDEELYQHRERVSRCVHQAELRMRTINSDEQNTRRAYPTEVIAGNCPRTHIPNEHDYEKLQPYFVWIPRKFIERTFENSTQYGYMPASPQGNLFKRWNAPNPAMNVFRLQDDLLTDKIYSDTPAINGGFKEAQVFFGRKSHIIHIEHSSKTKRFLQCLQNFVRLWGAPLRLLADHASYHASFQVLDYLRLLWIGLWFSEAYYKHQNPFERRYQTFKRIVNRTMDRTGTPPEFWYLCMCYVAYVLNRVSDPALNNRQPIFVATGKIGDISAITTFTWFEPVYYKKDDSFYQFPNSNEAFGHFVGIAEHVGHAMTYKIWNKETGKIVERSCVRSARVQSLINRRVAPKDLLDEQQKTKLDVTPNNGEKSGNPPTPQKSQSEFVYSTRDRTNKHTTHEEYGENAYLGHGGTDTQIATEHVSFDEQGSPMVVLLDDDRNPKLDSEGNAIMIPGKNSDELKGITFKVRRDDGHIRRARVIGPITETTLENRLGNKRGKQILAEFKIKYDSDDVKDIMTYNDIMNYVHRDQVEEGGNLWKYRRVLAHQGLLTHRDPHYKGSKYNVTIEWENGETTDEPLTHMIKEDPVNMAIYAKEQGLLDVDGWKRLKRIATRDKQLQRMVKQAKLRSFRTAPKYMYGFRVPRDYKEAIELDKQNGNTKWADATRLEMEQLFDYQVFIDKGVYTHGSIPKGFKKIRVHLVYAVKHDGRHKARLVADGHLTDTPLSSVYAGVVSIRGLRMVLFIAEMNGMEAYATDIGNAYLEATTQEKVCIVAGAEFADLEGHLLIVYKALYGLRSSGKQFGDLLASCLKTLGFFPSRAEPQIFMRENDGLYEYVATYVDDLCLVMRDPKDFLRILQSKPFNFKLKGSGPMSFHLGCGFERDENGLLCMNPRKYIDKMMLAYEQLFGVKAGTKPYSPLEEGDHPELDTSEFLDEDDTQKYQSIIGSLQWLITLGRWDIQTAVMSLSSFRAMPRSGHLDRAKRIYAYVNRFKHFKIRFRVEEPDMSELDGHIRSDWDEGIYEEREEDIPIDAPKPLGNRITLIHWFDANLMHDVLSGKAVTGCIHFANKTPMMWYSKKQSTVETATYGAEFVAGRTCIEQVIDLRNSFRYLGVPLNKTSYMFGDNESMINSSKYVHSKLHKRHNILSFHFVRSMIARGFISLSHTPSDSNLADVVTKHWGHKSVYPLFRPVFHHTGDTAELYIDDDPSAQWFDAACNEQGE